MCGRAYAILLSGPQPEQDAHEEHAGQHNAAVYRRLPQGERRRRRADLDKIREKRKYDHEDDGIDPEIQSEISTTFSGYI
ncbi:hypothetical protein SDC9_191719 [bioreactor metagenome]|uniref:Uncharacterized protein n=1 Tax=bioreactor metagenome TaxID=1076179 RepID=A0A645HYT0_9ZZZZ